MASDPLQTVSNYLSAVEQKDIERALSYFSDDAIIETPAGPHQGKSAIRAALQGVIARPTPPSPPKALIENGQVIARGAMPNGAVVMRFEFSGDLISRQAVTAD